jgi:hypothetical protein
VIACLRTYCRPSRQQEKTILLDNRSVFSMRLSVALALNYSSMLRLLFTDKLFDVPRTAVSLLQKAQQLDVSLDELKSIERASQWSFKYLFSKCMMPPRNNEVGAHRNTQPDLTHRGDRVLTKQQQVDKEDRNRYRHSDTTKQQDASLGHHHSVISDKDDAVLDDHSSLSSSAEGLTWLDRKIKAVLGHDD